MGGEAGQNREPKRICLGLLAHVDAGKTTLSEALLYQGGAIRRMGRVDKGDTFLDTSPLERQRGITIFSKQAQLQTERCAITLLDTPGHVDFLNSTWIFSPPSLSLRSSASVIGAIAPFRC